MTTRRLIEMHRIAVLCGSLCLSATVAAQGAGDGSSYGGGYGPSSDGSNGNSDYYFPQPSGESYGDFPEYPPRDGGGNAAPRDRSTPNQGASGPRSAPRSAPRGGGYNPPMPQGQYAQPRYAPQAPAQQPYGAPGYGAAPNYGGYAPSYGPEGGYAPPGGGPAYAPGYGGYGGGPAYGRGYGQPYYGGPGDYGGYYEEDRGSSGFPFDFSDFGDFMPFGNSSRDEPARGYGGPGYGPYYGGPGGGYGY